MIESWGRSHSLAFSKHYLMIPTDKGVPGGPSGPSREGPGVGHKIVSDTKQTKETKERKKMC